MSNFETPIFGLSQSSLLSYLRIFPTVPFFLSESTPIFTVDHFVLVKISATFHDFFDTTKVILCSLSSHIISGGDIITMYHEKRP